jgi:hypothetical protein
VAGAESAQPRSGHTGASRIRQLEETVAQLRDEVALLEGQKPRPHIAPSTLETPPAKPPRPPGDKRPGSAKRSKSATFPTPVEVTSPCPDPPPGSVAQGYQEYFVAQDLSAAGGATEGR